MRSPPYWFIFTWQKHYKDFSFPGSIICFSNEQRQSVGVDLQKWKWIGMQGNFQREIQVPVFIFQNHIKIKNPFLCFSVVETSRIRILIKTFSQREAVTVLHSHGVKNGRPDIKCQGGDISFPGFHTGIINQEQKPSPGRLLQYIPAFGIVVCQMVAGDDNAGILVM